MSAHPPAPGVVVVSVEEAGPPPQEATPSAPRTRKKTPALAATASVTAPPAPSVAAPTDPTGAARVAVNLTTGVSPERNEGAGAGYGEVGPPITSPPDRLTAESTTRIRNRLTGRSRRGKPKRFQIGDRA